MRRSILAPALVVLSFLAACERTAPDAPAAPATPAQPAAVVDWGPRSTPVGVAVNVQKDGETGLWIKGNGPIFIRGTVVTFDGKPANGIVASPQGDVLTMLIPADYIASPGKKPIVVVLGGKGTQLAVGDFEVTQ